MAKVKCMTKQEKERMIMKGRAINDGIIAKGREINARKSGSRKITKTYT